MRRLLDSRMANGCRHFGCLPESYDAHAPQWHRLRDHVDRLPGAASTSFVTDDVTEAWIDFEYRGRRFSMNNQQGEWWFFVEDPTCPDEILADVLDHFESLLDPAALYARRCGAMSPGSFRVVVHEASGRSVCRDFIDLETARQYADDAASEVEDGIVLAYVVDERFHVVHRGKHY